MAKVTLVRVPSLITANALTLSATPPISLAYLAGSLKNKGYTVKIIDSIGEAIDQYYPFIRDDLYVNGLTIDEIIRAIPQNTEYIGVSLPFSAEWPLSKKICNEVKRKFPNAILFCGGEHVTALPQFCMNQCKAIDYCVLGEGEETLIELINALETNYRKVIDVPGLVYRNNQGELIYTKKRKRISYLDDLPLPAWDLVPLDNYLSGGYSFGVNRGRTMPILATRGCPYHCTFCSNSEMWHSRWLARSPIKVIEEMEEYIKKYSIGNFDFYDLTAIIQEDWIIEFCNLLIERELNITWQLPSGTRSESLNSEVTAILYKSGCRNMSYAPESGSSKILKRIRKKITLDSMIESMKASISNHINIKANVIIGFPDEKFKNIIETYIFIIRMAMFGVHDLSVWIFSAYPGTEIFNDLLEKNIIPEFTDDYFLSLLSYSDLQNVQSWSDHLSSWQLKYLRLLGLVIFYFVSYLIRPFRCIKNIRNIMRHRPNSRLEMIVEQSLSRRKKIIKNDIRE